MASGDSTDARTSGSRQLRRKTARVKNVWGTAILTFFVLTMTYGVVVIDNALNSCDTVKDVTIVADSAIADAAIAMAADIDPVDAACGRADILPMDSALAQRRLAEGSFDADLWLLDSSLRLVSSAVGTDIPQVLSGSTASSPVVVVTGRDNNSVFDTWLQVLESDDLVLGNPLIDASSAEAVGAAISGSDTSKVNSVLAPLAREAQRAELTSSPSDRLQSSAVTDGSAITVASEQAANKAGNVRIIVPLSGTPSLDFPLVLTGQGRSNAAATAVGGQLALRLASPTGVAAVTRSGLRGPETGAADADGDGDATELRVASDSELVKALDRYALLALPSRALILQDISRSTGTQEGPQTRQQLAVAATVNGTQLFSNESQLGLWAFASNLQGAGRDYRPLVPVRPLGARFDDDTTQRQLVAGTVASLEPVDADTGLYDSVLAAWRTMQEGYDPAFVNSVVVVTDGRENDSQDSLTLDQLLRAIAEEADPARPVRIVLIGIGSDADEKALSEIAEATDGLSTVVTNPADAPGAFARIFGSGSPTQ